MNSTPKPPPPPTVADMFDWGQQWCKYHGRYEDPHNGGCKTPEDCYRETFRPAKKYDKNDPPERNVIVRILRKWGWIR